MQASVSVVMATYNRSNVIAYAVASLQRSTRQDWELIVVGDACTDDTEKTVNGLGDGRIRFVNLPENHGEQSGPNNAGVDLATGQYLAFLNHDDFWFADHLERCLAILEQGEADLVFGQGLAIPRPGVVELTGACCGTPMPYEPWMSVPATLWVMRRELALKVGPWLPSRELQAPPSQNWLYRAHRMGARMVASPHLGALIITSGNRKNSYRDRHADEHADWHARMTTPGFEKNMLASMLGDLHHRIKLDARFNLRNMAALLSRKTLLALRIWPPHLLYWIRYPRKGAFLRFIRNTRGLEKR